MITKVEDLIKICEDLKLTPIPLKPRDKKPIVRWKTENWQPTRETLNEFAANEALNWGIRGGQEFAALDFDTEESYFKFKETHTLPNDCPIVKTNRGYHIWMKPKKPVRSQIVDKVEIKGQGSYIVAPPSIHPSGAVYSFIVEPKEVLPEVDIEDLFGIKSENDNILPNTAANSEAQTPPSDFALKYGKSPYAKELCGKSTLVLTSPDQQTKKILNLRCWRWDCDKCAPLLQQKWLQLLKPLSFRFILHSDDSGKPESFLRRIRRPGYLHIVANGEDWLFVTDGDKDLIEKECDRSGYEIVKNVSDGTVSEAEKTRYLEQALCLENQPLFKKRKLSHSKYLFTKVTENDQEANESRQKSGIKNPENQNYTSVVQNLVKKWQPQIIFKSIAEITKQLTHEGWQVFWQSEVEATAFRGTRVVNEKDDLLTMFERAGVRLQKSGEEYKGLCPFHDDIEPSLSVNPRKGLWHCFGCNKGGDIKSLQREFAR